MSKTFRPWKIDQPLLLPPVVQDYVPRTISPISCSPWSWINSISKRSRRLRGEMGQPPFDPHMMTALLLYAYCRGIYSSRRIAKACAERVDFMMIVAHRPPDFRTIAEFRKRHLKALARLFLQVLKLAEKAGLVKLGHVALDGTKIKANASKHKAMSYERMKTREAELQAEVDRWLEAARSGRREEDKLHGATRRGEEMPDWIADKQRRQRKSVRQRRSLRPRPAAAEAAKPRRTRGRGETQSREPQEAGPERAPPSDEPDPKAQRNFTDPESRILKSKDGFIQAYNAQAAVDAGAQIIVAQGLTQNMNDCPNWCR